MVFFGCIIAQFLEIIFFCGFFWGGEKRDLNVFPPKPYRVFGFGIFSFWKVGFFLIIFVLFGFRFWIFSNFGDNINVRFSEVLRYFFTGVGILEELDDDESEEVAGAEELDKDDGILLVTEVAGVKEVFELNRRDMVAESG